MPVSATAGSSPRLRGILPFGNKDVALKRFIPAPAGNTLSCRNAQMSSAVHPRACGEYITKWILVTNSPGSSPRLRGIRHPEALHLRRQRFIPAPAGNTRTEMAKPLATSVHPRACGEYKKNLRVSNQHRNGSSPRLRGIRDVANKLVDRRRFIPAPAGNTPTLRPRSATSTGSSPRLRGIPALLEECHMIRRFIPAPAGNTSAAAIRDFSAAVHPRACGEYVDLDVKNGGQGGSSPRLRGILFR